MRGSWLKSGVAMRMLSAPILICSLSARGYGQRSLKSILTWARVVHTRAACVSSPSFMRGCASSNLRLLGAPLLIRSTSTPSFYFAPYWRLSSAAWKLGERYIAQSLEYKPCSKNLGTNFATDLDGVEIFLFLVPRREVSLRFWCFGIGKRGI